MPHAISDPGGPDTVRFGRLSLPDAPLGVIGGPTPTPEIASAPDPGGSSFATSAPAAPVVPTPFRSRHPEPREGRARALVRCSWRSWSSPGLVLVAEASC